MISFVAIPTMLIAGMFSVATLFRWRIGFYGLLIFIPLAGSVTLALYPSDLPKLFKDIFFVLPLYGAFMFHLSQLRTTHVPKTVVGSILALFFLVLIQTVNPAVPSLAVAIIGAKVWLLYLPLVFLSGAFICCEADFVRLMRVLVLMPVVPCILALVQYTQITLSGYESTMIGYYGGAALEATQRFFRFSFGGITLYRIPSTFTFHAQFFMYILAALVPAYTVARTDPKAAWRGVGLVVLLLVVVAGFLSGARSAFVFIPLWLAILLVLEGRVSTLLLMAPIGAALLAVATVVAGFDLNQLIADTQTRIGSQEGTVRPVVGDFLVALRNFPLGQGTGMDTGPARLVTPDGTSPFYIETYYGKAVLELGVPGLVVVIALFVSVAASCAATMRTVCWPNHKIFAAGVLAYVLAIIVNSLKGWMIDVDPTNILFWVYVGVVFQLPYLEGQVARTNEAYVGRRVMDRSFA